MSMRMHFAAVCVGARNHVRPWHDNMRSSSMGIGRAVTSMEHKLGVSDNELPGGKHSVDKGQFALSTYDQSILAGGPPISGSGA